MPLSREEKVARRMVHRACVLAGGVQIGLQSGGGKGVSRVAEGVESVESFLRRVVTCTFAFWNGVLPSLVAEEAVFPVDASLSVPPPLLDPDFVFLGPQRADDVKKVESAP